MEANMLAQVIRRSPLALLAALAVNASAQAGAPHLADSAMIETFASREVRIVPDRATLTLAVETRAPSAAQAAQMNAKAQRAVLDTLRSIGISPSQMGTTGFTVQAAYEPSPKGGMVRNGFQANNSITVRLTQLDRIGTLIDAALAKGATNVGELNFEASNTSDARRAALADAATQAKTEAMTIAKALGGTIGPLIMATTRMEGPTPGPRPMAMRAMAADETPIVAGDIVVGASILARWVFVPNP
jgi:uncharacterized protein YggE